MTTQKTLDTYIAEAASVEGEPAPGFAERVVAMIPPADREAILVGMVQTRTASVLGARRNAAVRQITQADTEAPVVKRAGKQPVVRSRKQELIREQYWPELLRTHVATASGWKMLGDATVDDMRFIAAQRYQSAARLTVLGDQFSRLADLMEQQHVVRLADLDNVESATQILKVA